MLIIYFVLCFPHPEISIQEIYMISMIYCHFHMAIAGFIVILEEISIFFSIPLVSRFYTVFQSRLLSSMDIMGVFC